MAGGALDAAWQLGGGATPQMGMSPQMTPWASGIVLQSKDHAFFQKKKGSLSTNSTNKDCLIIFEFAVKKFHCPFSA